eukprot:CAMPEP_0206462268 /NCGR_PEP_ID=MMETSP0324_2-20121206/25886_1 /ASSEMBLY_ACC=CAM_ASM_000836 /TAXON_ID=2866 /ORGANISM="Crypthecodinium cohnii, Strain Seligo" /LENGTH=901 /DNA_ID=CAMNT_0053934409 /DNA_START=315 /DNA_END=3020 /DNA_ORIENTATION=-
MSVDLGHEFFKVALMRQGVPLEIVLNTHSKRKTTTAVSFFESVRTFGDDALAHHGKAPTKVPMFFHSTLGKNYTSEDTMAGGKWWSDFGLGDQFYNYVLGYDLERGSPTFMIGDNEAHLEEALANIFFFAKQMADDSGEGKVINVKDLVVTVPTDATLRQRQAVAAAAEIAGLRLLTLVHETSAFAVHRALDFSVAEGAVEHALYYNMGARKVEVSVMRLEARNAGMVKGKTAPVVSVVGSALDYRVGGHLMDLKIAEVMLKRFQEKHPKLADGVAQNNRALRKLLSQAQKCKATLSANKQAPFIVESLFEDTDFQASLTREDFEGMCEEMFAVLTEPIEKALKAANVTLHDIKHFEVVGGAWRVPKVQQLLTSYLEEGRSGEKLPLGQHLNGEEAGALGAALVAANSSSSFRIKKIFFSDISQHEYSVQIAALSGAFEKNVTVLYPVGAPLGSKKKPSFECSEDFSVKLMEDGVLLAEYEVTGLKELVDGKWKEYNMTGPPKVSLTIPLEHSGLIDIKSPTVTVEEAYWVNVTKEKPKNATNSSAANATSKANSTEKSSEDEDEESSSEGDNTTNASEGSEEPEVIQKLKKKKHEKKLKVVRKDFMPRPLSDAQIADLKQKLQKVAAHEQEVQAAAGIKNELEAAIYGARDKMDHDDFIQVSTEEQREELSKLASELEDWMFEPGSTKSEYEAKLASLQNLLKPIEERMIELEHRSGFDETVMASVKDLKAGCAEIEKDMPWVNTTKTAALLLKVEEFGEWWTKKIASQASLPLSEAPAYTVKEVQDKLAKLHKDLDKLKKTKKPKETPKPKAKDSKASKDSKSGKASKDKGEEASTPPPQEEKLPETIEATEAELTALRQKKADAVEQEDFDTAQSLKGRESALSKHLEKLKGQEKTEL